MQEGPLPSRSGPAQSGPHQVELREGSIILIIHPA